MSSVTSVIFKIVLLVAVSLPLIIPCSGQEQIPVNRIEMMPNKPEPFILRDWKRVAIGYDSLVFNLDLKGDYLPLTRINNNTVNYPEHESFHQHTFVGDTTRNESINSFMAIIGATLCGVNKRDHYGKDWVLMCEEWFNKESGLNLYSDAVGRSSEKSFWYDLIPNVLFYQLYDLYGNVGQFENQFTKVADRVIECLEVLGGQIEPRRLPNMNYRGFNFVTMKPFPDVVSQPDAAGAMGWLLHMAYIKTDDKKYLDWSKLCIETFSGFEESPVFELQYLYGTAVAARMNAELGTQYDLNKMMNWCFDVGPLRRWAHTLGWGAVVGKWNGMDASGLLAAISKEGNTDFGDFSFIMNNFQLCGVLAPVARYDTRYARALGKYILNASSSMRWFYSAYLPVENQDCHDWASKYDLDSYIAYEALRQYKNGKSPFATGDAKEYGWAKTNLSLYSSSAVGYLGGILQTTNIEAILKIDLLKTDFFHHDAYPTFLYYNPYDVSKLVNLDLRESRYMIYEASTNKIIAQEATGTFKLNIPADSAFVIVLAPSNGKLSNQNNKTLINHVVADFD
jgi:hypothetical protein